MRQRDSNRVAVPGLLQKAKPMKFCLVDRIEEFTSRKSITAAKNVSLAEEYLADHFPGFPVLPGVMMLEAAVQAAAWIVREANDFQPSLVVLKEARGIRYGSFVQPGRTLVVNAQAQRLSPEGSEFKIRGMIGGDTAITGRIELAHLRLSDRDNSLEPMDRSIAESLRRQWRQLQIPGAVA